VLMDVVFILFDFNCEILIFQTSLRECRLDVSWG
jgi:hypothetical protein